jgi:hypothetical protein
MEAARLSEISGQVLDAGERIELTLDTVAFSLQPHVLEALTSTLLMLGDRARQEREKNPIHADKRGFGMALHLVGAKLGHITTGKLEGLHSLILIGANTEGAEFPYMVAAEPDKLEALATRILDYLDSPAAREGAGPKAN